ncbi:unnamed protein product [Ectocarpus sp. CCAP 1310/34]|nr:unnamed protein product [Ectocarpus sp. CCAP 1310/34]
MMQSVDDVKSTEETSSHHRRGRDVPSQAPSSRPATATTVAARALSNADNPLLLAKMLDLASITRISWLCRKTREGFGRKAHKVCLTHGAGVPEDRRVEFWMCVLNVKKEMDDKVARAKRENPGNYRDVYEACLYGDDNDAVAAHGCEGSPDAAAAAAAVLDAEASLFGANAASVDGDGDGLAMPPPSGWRVLSRNGAEGEISRDVGRTFPRQDLFKSRNGPGQNLLANVLKACLKTNPDVGYCQGMNFVAGSLLLACATRDPAVGAPCYPNCDRRRSVRGDSSSSVVDDDDAGVGGDGDVSPFVATAASTALSPTSASAWEEWDDFDGSGEDDSQVRVFQFDKLMLRELPRLYNHFKAKQLQLEVLVSQWFLTLFSYSLRPPMLLRVLDLTFTDGWKAMFRFGLARLRSVEDTLCGLELEGVSSFLRNFRDGGDYSPPPSPPRQEASSSWYNRAGKGWGGLGGGPRSARGEEGGEKALPRQCSSVRLLRETAEVKLTRSTLNSLQQDFAVQLLKEHLQGEGQWLTRYGDAPDPTPGAGAGVVGGDRDGDVGFMGVEAMTRMMLSDTKLLKKLKESLAKMAAPLQEDARIFQNKITEASERLEEATRERTSLSSELLRLKEDIEALGQRKKLVADQMHLLLVQFERDSAVYTPEQAAAGEEAAHDSSSSRQGDQGGRGDVGDVAVVSLSPTSSAAGSAGGFVREFDTGGVGEGEVESDVVSFFSGGGGGGGGGGDENSATGGIVIEPVNDGRAVGDHNLTSSAAAAGAAGAAAAAVSGGGSSEGESTTGRNSNNNNDSDDDRCSSSIRSRSSSGSGCCEGDSIDDDGPLNGRTHRQEHALGLPGAPAAAAAAGAGADGTPFAVASKPQDPVDASSGSPAVIALPRGPLAGKNTEMIWNAESDHCFLQHLPPPPSWKPESIVVSTLGEEGTATAELSPPPPSRSSGSGNCSSAVGRAGGDLITSKPRTPRLVAVSPRPGRSFSPPSSPKGGFSMGGGPREAGSGAGGRLSMGARGDDDGTARGFGKAAGGDGSGAEEKDTAWRRLAKWVGSSSGSTVGGGGGGGTSAAAAKLAAVASAGSSMSYSRWFPGSRLSPGSEQSGASLSPTPWSRRRGKKERPTPTLMEELYQDLAQLRTRLEEVQAGIDDKSDMYATLYHSYTRVLTEAEEAEELKRALSSQMIQLLFEQEQRLEGYLRQWITFDGGAGPGLLAAAAAGGTGGTFPGAACGNGGTRSGPGGVVGCNSDVTTAVAVSTVTDAGVDTSPGGEASPSTVSTRASGVGRGGRNVDGGDEDDDDDDDGSFEKVDAWMADGERGGAPQTGMEGCIVKDAAAGFVPRDAPLVDMTLLNP